MATALLGSFFRRDVGCTPPTSKQADNQAVRALPSNWYTSPEMYELERRAIFCRKWQLITHKSRLVNAGDWLNYDVANYSFVLCRDRDGIIHGFHNVCRHRAFPVVLEEKGTSKIFSCKYHGWSYGLNGKLAKAPGYQELEGFDKSKNGLFPVHTRIDRNGFIWINLDGRKFPEIAWEDDLLGIDTQKRYDMYNFDDYVFDHSWSMDGQENWKILADNYNECYHCATSHPDIGAVADLQSYSVDVVGDVIYHNPATTAQQAESGMTVASTYAFPNVSTNVSPHFFMIQRLVPRSATESSMRYEVYRNKNSTDEQFQTINQLYKRVMSEDKDLCKRAQRNIQGGVFVNGEMHPRLEKGPLHFQSLVRDNVMAHHGRERAAREEIWPARQAMPDTAKTSLTDLEFCRGLSSCEVGNDALEW